MKSRIIKRKNSVAWLLRAVSSSTLVVVSAPMGYGKTTVAHEFSACAKKTTYFYSLPSDSSDTDSLWDSLWRAMEAQGMEEAPLLRRMGFPHNPLQIQQAIDILENASPAIFILDDYHHCSAQGMNSFIETAVRNGMGGSCFLLFSRTRPSMELDELQVKGLAVLYDQTLLAFSPAEAKEFFFLNGVLDESAADHAWDYSEGWAAALWLCLRNSQRSGSQPPSGDVDSLLDRVVFSVYSPEDRRFLLHLSLLDSFTAAEAAAVTMDSDAVRRLTRIRTKNAFISRDGTRRRYRFHSIFRDFLQSRFKASHRNHADLYRRIAECHAARKEYMASYRFLVKAGREKDQVRLLDLLLEQNSEIMTDSRWEEIHAAVQTIPWRVRLRNPFGYLAYLWLYINLHSHDLDEAMIYEAAEKFRNAKNIPGGIKKRLAGEMEFIYAALAMNNVSAIHKHYKKARELLSGPTFLPCDRLSWTYCSPHLTFPIIQEAGEYDNIVSLLQDLWEDFSVLTGGVGTAVHLVALAERQFERGEFDETERLLSDLDALANKRERLTLFLLAQFLRSRLLLAQGKAQEGAGRLLALTPMIEKTDMFEHIMFHDLALGYILGCMGRTDNVPRWIADGNVYEQPYGTKQIQSFILSVYGKTLLARGDYNGLAAMLDTNSDDLGSLRSLFGRIHRKVFEAILARRRYGLDGAMPFIQEAIDLSRNDDIVTPFVEYGDTLLPLLRRLKRGMPADPHLENIYSRCNRAVRFSRENRSYKKSLLTTKERNIMRLIEQGKTTPGIALTLGVAESTVKSTLSLVYAKLGVGSRIEAAKHFRTIYGRRNTLK